MPTTIFLEFKHEPGNLSANGTDVTFFIDGRWSAETTRHRILDRVQELRMGPRGSAYAKQLFVGYTHSGGRQGAIRAMADPEPPAWFCELPDDDKTFAHEIKLSGWRRNNKPRRLIDPDDFVVSRIEHHTAAGSHASADCPGGTSWPCG